MNHRRKQHLTTEWRDVFTKHKGGFSSMVAKKNFTLTRKARGGLLQVLSSLGENRGTTVLVPAFHCVTVVQPVILAGFAVKFFNINKDLSIDNNELKSLLTKDVAAVVIINYFGFEQDICNLKAECEEVDALLIEDCSHSMMKRNPTLLTGSRGHVAIYSFWKNVSSMVGSGIVINDNSLVLKELPAERVSFLNRASFLKNIIQEVVENLNDGNVIKNLYVLSGKIKRQFKRMVHCLLPVTNPKTKEPQDRHSVREPIYPIVPLDYHGPVPIISKHIINSAQLEKIQQKVVGNYLQLLKYINEIPHIKPVFSDLPEHICPWTFAVFMENRKDYDFKLLKKNVNFFTFGETLHAEVDDSNKISEVAKDNARYLSESMICFSINHQIDETDLAHTRDVLKPLFY